MSASSASTPPAEVSSQQTDFKDGQEEQAMWPTPLEKRRQPWVNIVDEIKKEQQTSGDSCADGNAEWFNSKEGYYYNHTT